MVYERQWGEITLGQETCPKVEINCSCLGKEKEVKKKIKKKRRKMKGMERKKKSRFGWEKCFHNQEELFKLANIMWPNDPLPFIFLLACFPPPREHLKKGKEQADVPGSCWWEFRGTSELLFSLQRHPAGNHDSQLGHKGLAINLGI